MKKYLSTSNTLNVNKAGFTLVELLVVIAIIAILSVIGMTVYSGVQSNARDARRKVDIDAIANAMEANYDNINGRYNNFNPSNFITGGSAPTDPLDGSSRCGTGNTKLCRYCGRNTAGTAMTQGENTASACTGGGTAIGTNVPVQDTAFEVCATLENGSTRYYCRTNQR